MKLSKELSRRGTGTTLYILDEPTTGLHFEDTHKLLDVLNKLVDQGNTVVIIEHNLDVIKSADYVVDLGPEGGAGGGRIVAQGTPEEVARSRESYTGQFLADILRQTASSGVLMRAHPTFVPLPDCGPPATKSQLSAVAKQPQLSSAWHPLSLTAGRRKALTLSSLPSSLAAGVGWQHLC